MFFIIIDPPNIIDKSHFYAKLLLIRIDIYIVYIDDKSLQKTSLMEEEKGMSSDLPMDCRTST